MKRSPQIYIENLSLWNLLVGIAFVPSFRNAISNTRDVFYIDHTTAGKWLALLVSRLSVIHFRRLDFKMMDIKDDDGELVRLRISRHDLFEFQKVILHSETYQQLHHVSWNNDSIQAFVDKGLVDGGIMDKSSVSHMLFVVNVVNWHLNAKKEPHGILLVNQRPWQKEFHDYCISMHIELLHVVNCPLDKINKATLRKILSRFPFLFSLLKSVQYSDKKADLDNMFPKLYLEGRGDVNLQNDGHHSDFFWLLNSDFSPEKLLYQYHSVQEKVALKEINISVTSGQIRPQFMPASYVKPKISTLPSGLEKKLIKSMISSYVNIWHYWHTFFLQQQIKIHMFWHRFNNYHIAVTDAIHAAGGVSVYWPVSFDGFNALECASTTDIVFSYSHFSAALEEQNGSTLKYNIITGYPKDYAANLLKEEALHLREQLKENGAEKIIFVIDENSIDDERWHTGHQLQRDNYRFVLEKMLQTPWLGVVFKPKIAKTLRQRLGPVANLLKQAEETGRCFIYETSNRHTTSAPPILAGLSADVCIHGHLSAGTAALECALEGLPTLLIDREGMPASKLHELPRDKVVFDDWSSAIEAVMCYFDDPEEIPGFGDWSSILDELDPFRDGRAAYRIGAFLQWLMDGFEQGLERNEAMKNAAHKYVAAWGADKVISMDF